MRFFFPSLSCRNITKKKTRNQFHPLDRFLTTCKASSLLPSCTILLIIIVCGFFSHCVVDAQNILQTEVESRHDNQHATTITKRRRLGQQDVPKNKNSKAIAIKNINNNNNNNNIPNENVKDTLRNDQLPTNLASLKKSILDRVGINKNVMSNNDDDNSSNNNMTAIIHIGPLKTGSTSIQIYLKDLRKTLSINDHYEMPTLDETSIAMGGIRDCFWERSPRPCQYVQLEKVKEIAQRKNNIIISAENLSWPNTNIIEFQKILQPWKRNIVVVAYYRRFYDWIHSQWNQQNKLLPWSERTDFVTSMHQLYYYKTTKKRVNVQQNKLEDIYSNSLYTYGLVKRWSNYFDTVKVYNMHDESNATNNEKFFCDAIPDAVQTCERLRKIESYQGKILRNPSQNFVYEDLAHAAMQLGYISKDTIRNMNELITKIKYQHEEVWKLSKYDFPIETKRCLDPIVLDYLYEKTIYAEQYFFPNYYKSIGSSEIEIQFTRDKTTKLCTIDAMKVLQHEQQQQQQPDNGTTKKWKNFFQSL